MKPPSLRPGRNLKDWKIGTMEGWKNERSGEQDLFLNIPSFHYSFNPFLNSPLFSLHY
jgi:hypothetical protein